MPGSLTDLRRRVAAFIAPLEKHYVLRYSGGIEYLVKLGAYGSGARTSTTREHAMQFDSRDEALLYISTRNGQVSGFDLIEICEPRGYRVRRMEW